MSSSGPSGINAGEERAENNRGQRWKRRLTDLIDEWKQLRDRIEDLLDDTAPRTTESELERGERLNELRDRRKNLVGQISDIALARGLQDFAVAQGFREDLLRTPLQGPGYENTPGRGQEGNPVSAGGGQGRDAARDSTGGGQGGGDGGGTDRPRPRLGEGWRLPGVKDKDYTIVRSPKGTQLAVYKIKVGGNVVKIAVQLPRRDSELGKYGVKKGEGRQLTAAQMKGIQNIGWAEEIGRHFRGEDRNPFQALKRSLKRQYGGQPILDDDEVMGLIIANSVLGWTPGEFENQLRNTRWYRNTNDYQRDFQLTQSPKQRKDTINQYFEQVENHLEDTFGDDWYKHVKGGRKAAREWAEKIASGQWGTPDAGFNYWSERMFDRAAQIENTPAWMQEQSEAEERRRMANRPEEMFERLRTEAMGYLGQDKNDTPRIDRATLQQWAGDLVSGVRSEGDWAQFLRDQMKVLYPVFDPNRSFQEQASPFKSVAERIMGTTLDWSDKLFQDFTRVKANGEPTDKPMSLYDFELKVRQDERAWRQGTQLFEEGLGIVQALENVFKGVG